LKSPDNANHVVDSVSAHRQRICCFPTCVASHQPPVCPQQAIVVTPATTPPLSRSGRVVCLEKIVPLAPQTPSSCRLEHHRPPRSHTHQNEPLNGLSSV